MSNRHPSQTWASKTKLSTFLTWPEQWLKRWKKRSCRPAGGSWGTQQDVPVADPYDLADSDPDLAVLYRSAVAHILVSRLEGFGLTIVEAMASGCPVVTTKAGSLAEVAGDAALVVDPEDHAAIGTALARLAQEPKLRAECISRGRERAPRFSRRAFAKETAGVYRRFLA